MVGNQRVFCSFLKHTLTLYKLKTISLDNLFLCLNIAFGRLGRWFTYLGPFNIHEHSGKRKELPNVITLKPLHVVAFVRVHQHSMNCINTRCNLCNFLEQITCKKNHALWSTAYRWYQIDKINIPKTALHPLTKDSHCTNGL